jgi:hypothetical protein
LAIFLLKFMPTLELLPNRLLKSPAERYMPVLTDKADMLMDSPLKLTRCAYPTENKQQRNRAKNRLSAKEFFMVLRLSNLQINPYIRS